MILSVVLFLVVCFGGSDARVITKSLQKHHQISPKLHHSRWFNKNSRPSLPVGGNIWPVAIYWTFITVGSPGKNFPVAIDSGSFTLDIPLKGCSGCVSQPPNAAYNPGASKTSHLFTCSFVKGCEPSGSTCHSVKKYCGFSNTYETCVPTNPNEECTITGAFYSDLVSFGGSGNATVTFGAIQSQTSNFEQFQNIDGVVGMANGGNPGKQSVMTQLANSGAIDSYMWALCLQPGTLSNGTITIGGIDSRLYTGQMLYTPNTGGGVFYQMQLNGISAGNTQVYIDESQVIIDSGTNILLLPDETYTSMKTAYLNMCSSINLHGICDVSSSQTLFDGKCFTFTQAQINVFPNITLAVPGINLVMNARNYILLNYGTNFQPGQYCLGIANTGPQGNQIVGDTLLENYYTVFDIQNNRIGWAPVSKQCGTISA